MTKTISELLTECQVNLSALKSALASVDARLNEFRADIPQKVVGDVRTASAKYFELVKSIQLGFNEMNKLMLMGLTQRKQAKGQIDAASSKVKGLISDGEQIETKLKAAMDGLSNSALSEESQSYIKSGLLGVAECHKSFSTSFSELSRLP